MAERTVSVVLRARVEQYRAAMASAAASTSAFTGLSQRELTKVGTTMQTIGKRMSTWLTLPIVGVGAVATKMAMDFDTAFGQIQALTNVSAQDIDGLKESVLDLAGTTATAPQELAEALYFAASAGLDSAAAMDVVTSAAQASASGMGQTQDVVRVLAAALNVYGESNLSAADAADILTAAVQEGAAAPEEYAESLGRVIPIAAQMGIGFDEVAGSVAFLTNQGLDADEAVTALRGTMLALLDPSKQGRKTLEEMGTSFGEVQAAIAEDGLLGALELLRDHGFAGNSEAMSNLFEDNRALVGAMNLVADESGTLDGILAATANSAGVLGEAFATTADTDAFKMRQALVDVQTAMVQLGGILLPVAADVAGAIADMVTWFTKLPGPVQVAVGGFVGLVAALGPLTFVAGTLIKNLTSIGMAMGLSQNAAAKTAKAFSALGVAALVGVAAWNILGEGHLNAGPHIQTTADALINATSAAFGEVVAAGDAAIKVEGLALAHEALSLAISDAADNDLSAALASFNVAGADTLGVLTNLRGAVGSIGDDMGSADQAIQLLESRFGKGRVVAEQFWTSFLSGRDIAEGAMQSFADFSGIAVEEVQSAFEDMNVIQQFAIENRDEINSMALAYLDATVKIGGTGRAAVLAAQDLAGNRREAQNAIPVYEEFVEQLLLMEPAERDAILASNDMTSALAGLSPEAVAAALGVEQTTSSLEEVAPAALTASEAMEILADGFASSARQAERGGGFNQGAAAMAEWADIFGESLSRLTGQQSEYIKTQDDIHRGNLTFADDIHESSRSLANNTEEGLQNRDVIMGLVDNLFAHADAQLAAGDTVEHVTETFKHNRDAMIDAAVAAGFERGEVEDLIDALGAADGDWTAVMKVSGDQLAMRKIEEVLLELGEFDAEFIAELNTVIETQGAVAGLEWLLDRINSATGTVNVRVRVPTIRVGTIDSGSGFQTYVTRTGAVLMARGGVVDFPTAAILGEAGKEAVLPLTDPARMAAILGMPGVFGPVAAAMAKLVPSGTASMMGGGGGTGGGVFNLTLNHYGPGEMVPDAIVRALRQYERRSGPIPISVR